jgi:hypothetical protein
MSEETNNYSAAAGDLENREFGAQNQPSETRPEISREEVKPTSLGKATNYAGREGANDEPALLPGYHEIYSENFPTKGIFYPKNARFFIRAASVKEIRHFSTINEEDPFSIDEALNEIVKGCLMLRYPGKQASFKDLKEEDRIYIIMTIRELTFVDGENKLGLKKVCEECNHENEIIITKDSFQTVTPPDTIMKYYDEETRRFLVQTRSSGTIELTPPSIGSMMEISKWIRNQQQEGRKIDQSFIKVLPYMITDWRGLNSERIKQLEIESMQWSDIKYQTFNSLSEMARTGVKETLHTECEKCGSEVTTPITFPGGIKSLFVISDITGELI